jgi:hypothetical protein
MNIPFENLSEFLAWLSGPTAGGLVVVMWFVSWLLEKNSWWHSLQSKTRSAIIWGASVLIGVGAFVLAQNPELVATIDPYFKVVLYVTVAWLATQVAHNKDPERYKREATEFMSLDSEEDGVG